MQNEPIIYTPKITKQFKREPIIGFAIAASVAAIAILGIQNKNNIVPNIETNTVAMDEKIIDSQYETFSFPETQITPVAIEASTKFNSFTQQRLNNYLINHSKYKHNINKNQKQYTYKKNCNKYVVCVFFVDIYFLFLHFLF